MSRDAHIAAWVAADVDAVLVEERWAEGLPVVRVELHGDPTAVRAVLIHLAVELPGIFGVPGVWAALTRPQAAPA